MLLPHRSAPESLPPPRPRHLLQLPLEYLTLVDVFKQLAAVAVRFYAGLCAPQGAPGATGAVFLLMTLAAEHAFLLVVGIMFVSLYHVRRPRCLRRLRAQPCRARL